MQRRAAVARADDLASTLVTVRCQPDVVSARPACAASLPRRASRRVGLRARAHHRRLHARARAGRRLRRAGPHAHQRRRARVPARRHARADDRRRGALPGSRGRRERPRRPAGEAVVCERLHARRAEDAGRGVVVRRAIRRRADPDLRGGDRAGEGPRRHLPGAEVAGAPQRARCGRRAGGRRRAARSTA